MEDEWSMDALGRRLPPLLPVVLSVVLWDELSKSLFTRGVDAPEL